MNINQSKTIIKEPKKLDQDYACRYCNHTMQLTGNARSKAIRYFNQKKFRYGFDEDLNRNVWFVDPIAGTHTIHRIWKEKGEKGFRCSCQNCQTKIKKGEYEPLIEDTAVCSHILGLYFKFKFQDKKFSFESNVKFFFEKKITKFGNGAKIDAPKEYLGKKVIVLVCEK